MLVTDRRRVRADKHEGEEALDDVAREAALGGATIVQLREKDLATTDVVSLGLHVRDAITDRALLLVNGDLDAAHALGAAGIHLPEEGRSIDDARGTLGDDIIVSKAVHDVDGARAAEEGGADMLVAGTVFDSQTHPGSKTLGLSGLGLICSAVSIPVIAIGGITAANAGDVIRAGASGVAVIGAIMDAPDPRAAARELRTAIDAAWAER